MVTCEIKRRELIIEGKLESTRFEIVMLEKKDNDDSAFEWRSFIGTVNLEEMKALKAALDERTDL